MGQDIVSLLRWNSQRDNILSFCVVEFADRQHPASFLSGGQVEFVFRQHTASFLRGRKVGRRGFLDLVLGG